MPIPKQRVQQAKLAGKVLGDFLWKRFPWTKGTKPMARDLGELVLNRTWRPFYEVIGMDGIPNCDSAGNVLRPFTTAKLSLRVPPTADVVKCSRLVQELFEKNTPHGAKVTFTPEKAATGWNAPALAPWLEQACERASQDYYRKGAVYMGEGGTIPFMGMLCEKFPEAQFLITGVLGPQSNAHGPNEFLHLPMGKRLTLCVAQVIADHFDRKEVGAKAGRKAAGKKKAAAKKAPGKKKAAGKKTGAKKKAAKRTRVASR